MFDTTGGLHGARHLVRLDAVAADFEHLVEAPAQDEVAVLIDLAGVAGMEHSAAQQLARALGHVEIAAHVRVPIADLTDLSRLHFPPVVVKNENLERLGIRLAHRGGRLGTRKRIDGNQAARLRRSVAVVDLRALDAQAVGGLA